MIKTAVFASLLVVSLTACKKDKEAPAAPPAPAPTASAKPTEPTPPPAEPAATAVELVEVDLAAFGPAFTGYVAMAPKGAKVELDDPSRLIVLSDTDFVSLSEAPGWSDAMSGLESDPDNKNIRQVSATEWRWERTPPMGTAWNVDVLVEVGKTKFSCNTGSTGTFTSSAMADQIAAICKSIKKKG